MTEIRAKIQVHKQGQVVHTTEMGTNAVLVGRAPDNDLILSDPRTSGRHAIFHLSADRRSLLIRDLGSTNGTFVNGERVAGSQVLRDGDEVHLGRTSVKVRLHSVSHEDEELPIYPALLVDLQSGVAVPVTERMRMGSSSDCHVRLPDTEPLHASLTIHDEGAEIWVGTEDTEFQVAVGVPFTVADREFVLRESAEAWSTTQRESGILRLYPYRLSIDARLEEAVVTHTKADLSHTVTSARRVALLFVLARRRKLDLEEGQRPSTAGWLDDRVIMSDVWGRASAGMTLNNYQVLLSRLRKEIRRGGLDPWFLEKRQGHTRVRVDDIQLG